MRNHNFSLSVSVAALFWLLLVSPTCAAGVPEITKIDATLLQDKVAVSLSWKADAPVIEVRATGGKDMMYISSDGGNSTGKIVNERSPKGHYTGKITVELNSNYVLVTKVYASKSLNAQTTNQGNLYQSSMAYQETTEPLQQAIRVTVQVIDKYGQESAKAEKVLPTAMTMTAGGYQQGAGSQYPSSYGSGQPQTVYGGSATYGTTQAQTGYGSGSSYGYGQTQSGYGTQSPQQNTQQSPLTALAVDIVGSFVDMGKGMFTSVNVREAKVLPDSRLSLVAETAGLNSIQSVMFEVMNQQNQTFFSGNLSAEQGQDKKQVWRGTTDSPLQPGRYAVQFTVTDVKGSKNSAKSQPFDVTNPAASPYYPNQTTQPTTYGTLGTDSYQTAPNQTTEIK